MAFSLRPRFEKAMQRWLAKKLPPREKVTLFLSNIFIVPSRNGLLFVLASCLIFIAAINYAVSLAFALAFLMLSIFILAILYSFNNLNQLTLESKSASPVFCGEEANFKVLLTRSKNKRHEALMLNFPDSTVSHVDLVLQDREEVDVFTLTTRRGEFVAPRLRILTYFPLGLCRAWSVVDLNLHCLVYPKPVAFDMKQFNSGSSGSEDSTISMQGSEDYYGLREYVPGDSMRQIAW
jgi:uncharacterized protein (DUF58 family)